MSSFQLHAPPKPVGYLVLWEGYKVAALAKPSRLNLWLMYWAFGWKWEDV